MQGARRLLVLPRFPAHTPLEPSCGGKSRSVDRSRVAGWLRDAIFLGACLGLFGTFTFFSSDEPPAFWLAGLGLGWSVLLPLWVLVQIHSTLEGKQLRVRRGLFRWRIPIVSIESIRLTRNPLAGPALSLERLEVTFDRGKTIRISAEEPERFLKEIERLRPVSA